jgi:hypothetical protein
MVGLFRSLRVKMLGQLFKRAKKQPVLFIELNKELRALGSRIVVADRMVTVGNRSCQVFGRYIDFWENGMKWLGVDGVKDIRQMAQLMICWLEKQMNSSAIEDQIPAIQFPESRKKMEAGEEQFLDWYWQNLIERRDRRFGRIIELFANNPRTRRLMSFTRLRDFGFSRIIPPHEQRTDLPFVRVNDNWEYEVHVHIGILDQESSPRKCLGKGNAEEAYQMVLDYLPGNIGTARYYDSANPAA